MSYQFVIFVCRHNQPLYCHLFVPDMMLIVERFLKSFKMRRNEIQSGISLCSQFVQIDFQILSVHATIVFHFIK